MTMQKFRDLVCHIIQECSDDPSQLGAIRLNKILWFSDVVAYQVDGQSITGETYVKRRFGPAPKRMKQVLRYLEKHGEITITEPEFEFDTTRFESLKSRPDRLSNREKQIISAVRGAVLGKTANEISEMSHDLIWKIAEEGEEIPLCASLAAMPGEVSENDIQWAKDCMKHNPPKTVRRASV